MRPVNDLCLALDLATMLRGPRVGDLTGKNSAPGFQVIYERRPNEVVLKFPNGMVQTIGLWREEIHNGGHRDWFYLDGCRARRLWLAPDEDWFRDRKSLGLEYACRRMGRRRREARRTTVTADQMAFSFTPTA